MPIYKTPPKHFTEALAHYEQHGFELWTFLPSIEHAMDGSSNTIA